MCMKATPEGCELRDELKETKAAVASLDTRLTKVESDVGKMRSETLDAIDAAGGYCPCQVKSADSKCHCKDFRNKKALGEPCICDIYVKMAKDAKKKGAK